MFDRHALADMQMRPSQERTAGGDERTNRGELGIVHGDIGFAAAHDGFDARTTEDARALGTGEAAENVAGKKNCVDFFQAVRPASPDAVQGNILLESQPLETGGGGSFMFWADPYCKPSGHRCWGRAIAMKVTDGGVNSRGREIQLYIRGTGCQEYLIPLRGQAKQQRPQLRSGHERERFQKADAPVSKSPVLSRVTVPALGRRCWLQLQAEWFPDHLARCWPKP